MSFRIDQLAVLNLATVGNSITAGSFVRSGGTSSQFLKADGTVDTNAYITGITSGMVTTALGYTPVPNTRNITINGVTQDLSVDRTWTISAGVSSVTGSGSGISVSPTTGAVVVSNTGVTSNVAGTGISVSGATGAVTITNTGVTSIVAGTAITISGATGAVTINNAGVTSVNGNTGAITGIITTSNYNSYSPTLTGGGASGTWGISITGSATNSSTVGGISVNQIFNNMGNNHSTYTNFNNIPNFGVYYVQGTTNGPGTGSTQFYGFTLGLGNEYAYASYALQLAIPRDNGSDRYLSTRTREGGSWGSWYKINAGYADSAGNSATTSQTNFTSLTVNSNTVLHAGNYNSYSPTLTGGGASGTWSINITGSAGSASSASSVPWTGISSGTRTNYSLGFQPSSNGYAGFYFSKSTSAGTAEDAGYLLIRGTSDNDVYTAEGITLVADAGWLTLAQRTTASKGVRIMTGTSSTTRASFATDGSINFTGDPIASGSFRAPIFYDSQDTTYYADFHSTSQSAIRVRGGALHGPNPTWGKYLLVGGDGRQGYIDNTDVASVSTTNGNLHIDAASGYGTYINWYDGSELYFGRGNSSAASAFVNSSGYWNFGNTSSASYLIHARGDIYADGGWVRVSGTSGLYFETYGGGWHMNDSTWIRSYNGKNVYMSADVRTGGQFQLENGYSYWQRYGTWSSSLHRIAYMSFDWDGSYNTYSNHGISSTDVNGSFSDSMSINSFNDINLRLDSNGNNGDSYVRFHNDTTGNNVFSWIGYNGSNYAASFARDIYVQGGTGGNFGNRLIVGGSSTPYTLQDTNIRPTIYMTGAYPVLTLNHTETSNTQHGPTIQFAFNGLSNRQWVIGCNGQGTFMDFGFSSSGYGNTDFNPHNGISGYNGNTIMRIIDNAVGIGGDWGNWGAGNPAYTLDVRGTIYSNTDMRAPIFYDSDNTAYYGNFASTSVMNSITFGTSTTGATLSGNSDWGVRFSNSTGYIQLGPANGSYAHIYTDRGSFYFNVNDLYANGNLVLTAANYTNYTLPIGGGWYGVNMPGSRWGGYAVSGGEIVFGNGLPNAGQMGMLIDGAYVAGENNGFWSLPSNNDWNGRRGMYWDGSYLNFTANSPTSVFTTLRLANGFELQQGGSNYGQFNTWVHLPGFHGLYSAQNSAHFYPNNGTYGSWIITGSRNGWGGIEFGNGSNGSVVVMLSNASNESGFHNNSYGWQIFWSGGALYSGRNTYGGNHSRVLQEDTWISSKYFGSDGYIYGVRFSDSNDSSYFLDPNGTSELNSITTGTRARWGEPRWWHNRQAETSDQNYWTGTNGWGTSYGNWDNAWRGGFSGWDIWGTGTAHPQGSGYIHAQGIVSGQHYANSDGSAAYGWMMVGAADATANRYWLRGKWGSTTSGWVEMITSGNIGSQNVNYATTAGTASFASNSGNTNSVSNATGGTYTWTGINYFRSNLGGYCGSLSNPPLQAYSDSNNSAFFSFHKGGQYAVNMGLDADSVLRIGGWSAAANRWQLDMSGNMTVAGDVTAYSDARVKENVETVEDALDKVLNLRGVYYNRTDSDDKRRKVGVIAQEILEVIPEVVAQDNSGMYNVSYGNIVGVLIEAIKEQQKQIDELKARLD